LHHACHSRAQNIGWKSKDLLRLIPGLKVLPSERCSGHGGTWGFEQGNYETALKVGSAVIKKALTDADKAKKGVHFVTSDCPMAADHLLDGMEAIKPGASGSSSRLHPLEIVAKSFL
jgi:glycerol-3-phosphate dehydrogenase subunit C